MTVKEAFQKSYELAKAGYQHKLYRVNGEWVIV